LVVTKREILPFRANVFNASIYSNLCSAKNYQIFKIAFSLITGMSCKSILIREKDGREIGKNAHRKTVGQKHCIVSPQDLDIIFYIPLAL